MEKQETTLKPGFAKWFAFAICSVLILGALAAMWIHFDVQSRFIKLLNWLDGLGLWGPAAFTGIYALVVVLVLPGIAFTMGAGFLFGVVVGTLCVVIGSTVGATAAFLLARYGFRSRAELFIEKRPKLRAINEYVSDEALRVVILTRMIPFFPFKPSNYAFGVTGVRCREFVLGTMIGILPFTLTNVYAGAIAGDLMSLSERGLDRTPFQWAIYALGLVVVAAFAVVMGRRARARLETYRDTADQARE